MQLVSVPPAAMADPPRSLSPALKRVRTAPPPAGWSAEHLTEEAVHSWRVMEENGVLHAHVHGQDAELARLRAVEVDHRRLLRANELRAQYGEHWVMETLRAAATPAFPRPQDEEDVLVCLKEPGPCKTDFECVVLDLSDAWGDLFCGRPGGSKLLEHLLSISTTCSEVWSTHDNTLECSLVIAEALRTNREIDHVLLLDCMEGGLPLGPLAGALADVLQTNTTLKSLFLGRLEWSAADSTPLLRGLRTAAGLQRLTLYLGLQLDLLEFAAMLEKTPLQRVSVSLECFDHTGMGNEAILVALAAPLSRSTLREFSTYDTPAVLPLAAYEFIAAAVQAARGGIIERDDTPRWSLVAEPSTPAVLAGRNVKCVGSIPDFDETTLFQLCSEYTDGVQ
jgi:hypothetical protein